MNRIIRENTYEPWGRVLELSDGIAEIKVTIDIGPRIIYYALIGGPNIMYEDIDNKITKDGEFFDKNFAGKCWRIIGGHRLWKSPEDIESYYPDLDTVDYKINEDTVTFMSGVEQSTGILKIIRITMLGKGRFRICHEFVNKNKESINVSLWALTVLREGGKVYFSTNDRENGFLPTQNIVLWPYTNLNDARLSIFDNYMTVTQSSNSNEPFKIGAFLQKGLAAYKYQDYLFIKNFSGEGMASDYPDYGSNFEVYTNKYMIECESLSQLFTIPPEMNAIHLEDWNIIKCDDSETENIIAGK